MWGEAGIAALLGVLGLCFLLNGLLFGHRDPRHGGIFSLLFGAALLFAASVLGVGAWCLRKTHRIGWWYQLIPLGLVTWLLWDVLGYGR
jgi:hypothetical protein